MFERKVHRWLAISIMCILGGFVITVGIFLQMTSTNESSTVTQDKPFLSNSNAIKYVESSKLMVLVSNIKQGQQEIFEKIHHIYGSNASCIAGDNESQLVADAQIACAADQHVVAISLRNIQGSEPTGIQPYAQLALDHNYILSLVNEPENILPVYIGWHLNEADSCMLGLCANALLEDLLKTVPEFCSDFRNFSQSETINEMLKFYQLAPSNHNGMLHCTAKYFGADPDELSKEYFETVKNNITMSFETAVIGVVLTPRTFGARLKLSPNQLKLWGGDDDLKSVTSNTKKAGNRKPEDAGEEEADSVLSLNKALSQHSIENTLRNMSLSNLSQSPVKKQSARYFPNSQASLVYLTGKQIEDPDFHPVTGPGRKAHMTLGIAPGESAVTTGYDLLEVVELEEQEKDWPTFLTTRGWLRDYGENRWVLYMNNRITVDSLFAGVYNTL